MSESNEKNLYKDIEQNAMKKVSENVSEKALNTIINLIKR